MWTNKLQEVHIPWWRGMAQLAFLSLEPKELILIKQVIKRNKASVCYSYSQHQQLSLALSSPIDTMASVSRLLAVALVVMAAALLGLGGTCHAARLLADLPLPEVPGVPMPTLPDVPGIPTLPEVPKLPVPELPSVPKLPMPELPVAPGVPLPQVPAVP